jgi:hypothetical protein
VGKYIGSDKIGKAQFLVEKSWKGVKTGDTISLSNIDIIGCDYDLNPTKDEKYLIYAVSSVSSEVGLFISVDCGRSRAIADAKKDLKKMGNTYYQPIESIKSVVYENLSSRNTATKSKRLSPVAFFIIIIKQKTKKRVE